MAAVRVLTLINNILIFDLIKSYQSSEMFSKFQILDAVNAVKNPLYKIKASIKDMIKGEKIQITQIISNKLYHVSPLSEKTIQIFIETLKTCKQFQLWNLGEYPYSGQVMAKLQNYKKRNPDVKQTIYNLNYQYFANVPFCQMIKSIEEIQKFLILNPCNKVYIHCQDNKRRSAVFLACYIFLTGLETDIAKAILTVNKKLNLSMEDKEITQISRTIYKSQHLILKNLMNYINNSSFINKNCWNLKKIIFSNFPKIDDVLKLDSFDGQKKGLIKFKILLQIRIVEQMVYKKIFNDQVIEESTLCLRIDGETLMLKDDFLIIIKYVYEKKGYSILRAQLNTNFIYDQYFRVQRNDMDLSVNNSNSQNQKLFMDLILEENSKYSSELSKFNIIKDNFNINASTQNNQQLKLNIQPQAFFNYRPTQSKEQKQDDEFRILNQEEEAEHNQKIQRQIEQELAQELEKIRKKRISEDSNDQNEERQYPKIQCRSQMKQVQSQSLSVAKQLMISAENQHIAVSQNTELKEIKQPILQSNLVEPDEKKESDNQQLQKSQQSQSSSSEESQVNQQYEDLDDYLTKLEKQAERNQ